MKKGTYQAIPLSLIDRPPAPLRGHLDSELLAELAASLNTHGQLQPVVLRKNGERFTTIAGDRRIHAARSIGWERIEAKVYPEGTKDEALLSLIENMQREDLSPVEEARVIYNLVVENEMDVDLAATRFAKSRNWIEGRLALCSYPQDLLEAIHGKHITLSVARELVRVGDEGYRAWLLQNAKDNGATARTARLWADEWSGTTQETGQVLTAEPGPTPPYSGQPVGIGCGGCDELFPIGQLRPIYCCPSCIRDHFTMKAQARARAGANDK